MQTNSLINIIKHAKTFADYFFTQPENGLSKKTIEIQVADDTQDNSQSKKIMNFIKHLEKNNVPYVIKNSPHNAYTVVTADIMLEDVQQSIAVLDAICTMEESYASVDEDFKTESILDNNKL